MASAPNVEERLSTLENEMAKVKQQLLDARRKENWIEKITGSFEGDSDFEEILRLGKEFRQSQSHSE